MSGAEVALEVTVARGAFTLDVTLHAAAGETVAIMGPSGAGKSTLLATLAGLVTPTTGSIRLAGRVVDAQTGPHVTPRERGVVMLGQQPRLFPHLSARENVAFGLRARGVPRRDAHAGADSWLARVGLAGLERRRPAHLSGGQQQRVALARALATDPRVLLLDEPLTGLDPVTAAEIRTLLREQLAASGTTALLATHDIGDAAALAERVAVIEDGRITQAGPIGDVLAAPATAFVATLAAGREFAHPTAWQGRIEAVAPGAEGLRVRVRTAGGAHADLLLPADAAASVGATVLIRPPAP